MEFDTIHVETNVTFLKLDALEIFDEEYFVFGLPGKKQNEH